ncbi:MAG TPA: OmpA family protein [Bryobacteraceae bacterium]|nr:OmpA family protein [Bryobacteraceae bacterium]
MLRKCAALLMFLTLATGVWAQGLNVPPGVTKDDWEEINFEFNSSVLVDGFPSLLRLAELLQKNPGYKVKVEGHTDIIGGTQFNDRLGLARANAVRDFLVKYGANPSQITTTSEGKQSPRYPGQRSTFSKTDEPRWMNRRVALTVTDAQGNTVSAGGPAEAIRAIEQPKPQLADCCSEVLKRLDKLDDIAKMLKDLADANADLRKQVADLKAAQQTLESKVNQPPPPPPPTAAEIAKTVTDQMNAQKLPKFELLGLNAGVDDTGNTSFTGKGRFFAPFNEIANQKFAFEAQAEYLYFKDRREGQIDLGLVDRMGAFQAALFASFKHATLVGFQNGGTLGQGAVELDYVFNRGKVGFIGTYGFMNSGVVNTTHADPVTGAFLNNVLLQSYLKVVNQAGVSGTVGLWGRSYFEGNVAYLNSTVWGNRFGGTGRFIIPLTDKVAFTAEGDINPTLIGPQNNGVALFGLQFGNMLRPKEFKAANFATPVDVPRIRYDVLTRRVRVGNSPPVADAGPPQVNVPAGTITLNGSASYDPDGDPITFQWIQESGPSVSLSNPTAAITTFTAASGARYDFRLVVRDNLGGQAIARTYVTTASANPGGAVQLTSCFATPTNISPGESATLNWTSQNASGVSISGVGSVALSGSVPVTPAATTTYTVTATGAGGATTTCSIAVTVGSAALPRIIQFSATPSIINSGQNSTLIWVVENATAVNIGGLGNVAVSGSQQVSPSSTTTYSITATNAQGSVTATATVSVNSIPAPSITGFTASPNPSPTPGGKVNLTCSATNATSLNISGALFNGGNATFVVTPVTTTTYTCTATGQNGQTVSQSLTVTVNGSAPPYN